MKAELEPKTQKANSKKTQKGSSRLEQKKNETKQKILAAALHLFRTKGVADTTGKEISAHAQIAEESLLNCFPTKEDLALYFFQKETEDLIAWYAGQSQLRRAPLYEKLFAIVHRQLEQSAPHEELIGTVFFQSFRPRSKFHALSLESQDHRLKYLRFIDELLHEAAERKEIPEVGNAGSCVFGLFYAGVLTYWLHDTSREKQKTIALLDRSLKAAGTFLAKGRWEWT